MSNFPTLTAGSLAFADSATTIEDSTYTINATLNLSNINISDAPKEILVSQEFKVTGGPRFNVPSNYVNATYPTNGAIGIPASNLSQIVITDPQLPWIREFDYSVTAVRPWIALFALSPQDLTINSNLLPTGSTTGPNGSYKMLTSTLNPWPSSSSSITVPDYDWSAEPVPTGSESNCNMIFISNTLFGSLIPNADSHQYFAHCRTVNSGSNAVDGLSSSGAFSVIISNRFINSGPVMMHLVSLENVGQLITDKITTDYVGLVSLYSWSYTVDTAKEDFSTLFKQLVANSGPLRTSNIISNAANYPINPVKNLAQIANDRFADGYFPIRYHTSSGADTLAWSRGPFAPGYTQSIEGFISSISSAGSIDGSGLRVYDSISGTFDLTYTLAWQLGKNLLLSNKKIYQHLMQFRRTIYELSLQYAKGQLTVQNNSTDQTVTLINKLLVNKGSFYSQLPNILATFTQITRSNTTQNATNTFFQTAFSSANSTSYDSSITNAYYTSYTSSNNTLRNDDLDQVITWIQNVTRITNIPFHYLVQNPQAIPMESIRFFYVDPNWLTAMIDGAVSLVGNLEIDSDIRNLIRKIVAYQNQKMPTWGFFIRSTIVSTYPGLVINLGSDPSDISSDMWPIVRINPTLLMCLFTNTNYNTTQILIGEGPEQFRFGFDDELGIRDPDSGIMIDDFSISKSSLIDANNSINGVTLASSVLATLNKAGKDLTSINIRQVAIQLIEPPNYRLLCYGLPRTWNITYGTYATGDLTIKTTTINTSMYDFQAIDITYNSSTQQYSLGTPTINTQQSVSGDSTVQVYPPIASSISTICSYQLYGPSYTADSDTIAPVFSFVIGYNYLINGFSYNSTTQSLNWTLTPNVYSYKVDLMTNLSGNIGFNVVPFTKIDFPSQLKNLDFNAITMVSLKSLAGSYSMGSTPNWNGVYVLTAYDSQGNSSTSQISQPAEMASVQSINTTNLEFRFVGPASPIYTAYSVSAYLVNYDTNTWDVTLSSSILSIPVTKWAFNSYSLNNSDSISTVVVTNLYNSISSKFLIGKQVDIIAPGVSPCLNSRSPILNFGLNNGQLKWGCYPIGSRYRLFQVETDQLIQEGSCNISLTKSGDCICTLSGLYNDYDPSSIYVFELIDQNGYSYTSMYPSITIESVTFPNKYIPSSVVPFNLKISSPTFFPSVGDYTVTNFDNRNYSSDSQKLTYNISKESLNASFSLDTNSTGTLISIKSNSGLVHQVFDFGLKIVSFTQSTSNTSLLTWIVSPTALSYSLIDGNNMILTSRSHLLRIKGRNTLELDDNLYGEYLINPINVPTPPYKLIVFGISDYVMKTYTPSS